MISMFVRGFWSVRYFEQHFILIDWFVRSDAFKLCFIYQRPFSQRVKNIGSWQTAMEVMGIIGNTQNFKINIIVFTDVLPGLIKFNVNTNFLNQCSMTID